MAGKPKTVSRVITALSVMAITLASLELASMGYLYIIDSEGNAKERIRVTLDALQKSDKTGTASQPSREPAWMREHILHPYLGFVRNYNKQRHIFNRFVIHEPVNEYGFFGKPPVPGKTADKFVIAILGGSVATELFLYGRGTLKRELKKYPEFATREIKFVSIALGGFKQPQQLIALTYFLTLGARYDLVINLDGFNEVALPYPDNFKFGVSPFFPRNWRVYAEKSIRPDTASLYGKISDNIETMEHWRKYFSRKPYRDSHFFLLVWQHYSKYKLNQRAILENQLRNRFKDDADLTAQQRGPGYPDDSPDNIFIDSVALWKTASFLTWQMCESMNIKYFHFLQPNQYVKGSRELTAWERKNAYAGPLYPYRKGAEHGYPLLIKAGQDLKQKKVPYFDLSGIFRNESRTVYRDACCHFNKLGNDLLAKHIAEAVAGNP